MGHPFTKYVGTWQELTGKELFETKLAQWADSVDERLMRLEDRMAVVEWPMKVSARGPMPEEAFEKKIREQHHREALESAAQMLEEWGRELESKVRREAIMDAYWAVKKHKVQP